jgi:phosphatidylserine/phosphatidylglycerophosphate/cardiolipin synthase-like enzyme
LTLAEDIVALFERQRSRLERDVFDTAKRDLVERESEIVALARRAEEALSTSPRMIRLVLQALAIQYRRLEPHLARATLVATLPNRLPPVGTAATAQVVREMVSSATDEIVLLGYEVSEPEIVDLLVARARAGVRVTMVVDHEPSRLGRLQKLWPEDAPVSIYVGSENELTGKYASIHGKTLLVDQRDLLITSANFTHHGQEENVELGLRSQGGAAARAGYHRAPPADGDRGAQD